MDHLVPVPPWATDPSYVPHCISPDGCQVLPIEANVADHGHEDKHHKDEAPYVDGRMQQINAMDGHLALRHRHVLCVHKLGNINHVYSVCSYTMR